MGLALSGGGTPLILTGGKKGRVGMEASKSVVGGSKSLLRL